jgi:hypothetical protein
MPSPNEMDATTMADSSTVEDTGETPAGPVCTEVDASCDDGNPCTLGDTCDADGNCAGTVYSCDDGFDCTWDHCDGQGGCAFHMAAGQCLIDGNCYAQGTANPTNDCQECQPSVHLHAWGNDDNNGCDDGSLCTEAGTCQAGTCLSTGEAVSCDDELACTTDSCEPDTGCEHSPSDEACGDENSCTTDTCDPSEGCVNTLVEEGTACDDGSLETGGDTCSGDGVCSGSPIDCSSEAVTACTTAWTADGSGCAATHAEAGTSCDDSSDDTSADACDGNGNCQGTDLDCDSEAITLCVTAWTGDGEACNPTYAALNTVCDDGVGDTTDDVCDGAGVCEGTPIP